MDIYNSITELIGNTPLINLVEFKEVNNLNVQLLGKAECFNPSGSIKDRAALSMINEAIKQGKINKNTVIIEPTSGNTGISLAMIASTLGNRTIFTMPANMSEERIQMLKSYKAEVVLTPVNKGMEGAIKKAEELKSNIADSFICAQFDNPANALAHYQTTGPEIWQDSKGQVDILVAGVGTGGTISGIGKYLKQQKATVKVIAVEPVNSPVLSKGQKGIHNIQGIGAGFVPKILDREVYDQVITVSDKDAIDTAKLLTETEGLFTGISSGAALWAAVQLANKEENKDKTIVVVLPDSGNRYYTIWGER